MPIPWFLAIFMNFALRFCYYPASEVSKMGCTISVGQNSSESNLKLVGAMKYYKENENISLINPLSAGI